NHSRIQVEELELRFGIDRCQVEVPGEAVGGVLRLSRLILVLEELFGVLAANWREVRLARGRGSDQGPSLPDRLRHGRRIVEEPLHRVDEAADMRRLLSVCVVGTCRLYLSSKSHDLPFDICLDSRALGLAKVLAVHAAFSTL